MTISKIIFLALLANIALASSHSIPNHTMNHDHIANMTQEDTTYTSLPTQSGQGAFAAIEEIVAMLEADPATDWATVNIDDLREHLADMNLLITEAQVTQQAKGGQVTFIIYGEGRTRQAIQAMVPAHANEMKNLKPWQINTKLTDTGAVLTIQSNDADQIQKVKALGFFGFMATGAHHQAHHYAIAKGQAHH